MCSGGGDGSGGGQKGYGGQGAAANSGGSMMGNGQGGYGNAGLGRGGGSNSDSGRTFGDRGGWKGTGWGWDGQDGKLHGYDAGKGGLGALSGLLSGNPLAVALGLARGVEIGNYASPSMLGPTQEGYHAGNGNFRAGEAAPLDGQVPTKTPEQIAAEAEAKKAADLQGLIDKINGAFGADLNGMRSDIYNYHMNDLNKQKNDAERALRFQLARTGQIGGSVDVDENARMAGDYLTGSNKIGQLADNAVNSTKSALDTQRLALVGAVRNGQDVSTQLAESANTVNRNINAAKDAATGTALGRAFNVIGTQYDNAQQQAGINSILQPKKPMDTGIVFNNTGSNGRITGS